MRERAGRALRLPLSIAKNRLGMVPRPSWCTYMVCNRCNARCGMCDSWKLPRGYELTPDEVRAIFRELAPLDVVRLTGGEPFLRKDFEEVALAVFEESRPEVLHITSNGSFPARIQRFAQTFPGPERLRFMISFDGLPEEHDRNRGKVVSFERALDTVTRLVSERPRGIEVSINHTVISQQSLDDADGLRAIMDDLSVDVHSVLAYSDSAMYGSERRGSKSEDLINGGGYPLHPALANSDVVGFVDREIDGASALQDRALRIGKRYYLDGLRARLCGDPEPKPRPKCVALRSHIRVLPNGDVPVCQFNTEVVGNLRTESFDTVWHNASATSSRAWVDACKGCWAECEVIPSAIYSGDIVRSALS